MKTNFLGYLIASMVRNLSIKNINEWETKKTYVVGDLCLVGNNKYIAESNATSGHVKPTHTAGKKTDGSVMWQFVETINSAYSTASQLYMGIGTSGSTDSIDIINGNLYNKRLSQSNIRLGRKCKKWESGKKYDVEDIVLSTTNNVYFCVVSGDASSIEPSETSLENFRNSDNYVWRYITTISNNDTNFITDTSIPIIPTTTIKRGETNIVSIVEQRGELTQKLSYDASGANISFELLDDKTITRPWISQTIYDKTEAFYVVAQVHDAVGSGAVLTPTLSGDVITSVKIDTSGQDYKNAQLFIVDEKGSGAVLTPTIDNLGSITSVTVTNGGSGYVNPKIFVAAGDAGVLFKIETRDIAIESVLNNLDADTIIINCTLYDVDNYLSSSDNYNYVALMTNVSDKSHMHLGGALNNNDVNKIDNKKAIVIWASSFDTKQRSSGQEENITIEIKLVEEK